MLLRVFLDRSGHTPIGIALSQHGIDRATEDFGIPGLDRFFGIALWLLRIIGYGKSLRLQLLDRGRELRNGCADIGQLDNVGFRSRRQFAEFSKGVCVFLFRFQIIRKCCKDSSGQGDIARFYRDPCGLGKCLDDRQQGICC